MWMARLHGERRWGNESTSATCEYMYDWAIWPFCI